MQLQKRFIVGPCQGFPLSCYSDVINRTNTNQWMPNRCANPTLHTSHRFWCLVISISDTCQMKSKFWKIRDQLLSSVPFFIRMLKTWKMSTSSSIDVYIFYTAVNFCTFLTLVLHNNLQKKKIIVNLTLTKSDVM